MIIVILALLLGVGGLATGAYLTNPFNRFTVIRKPFIVKATQDAIEAIDNNHKLVVRQNLFWRWFAIIKSGIHILASRYVHSPRSSGQTVEEIIADIHKLRFDPSKFILISGDHFTSMYVRNLGVFYYPVLDTQIPSTELDWQNRQAVYLKTVAYALGVHTKYPVPATTIFSTGPYQATCVNFYAYPSDSVYGILYALSALLGKESARPAPYKAKARHHLRTQLAARILLREYRTTLIALYDHYAQTAFDHATGLIRLGLHMSGAKDITRRESSFYDNVVFWKTTQLAMQLGLIGKDEAFLSNLKQTILKTFWLEKEGFFLEDLSAESKEEHYYSSDWLIVLVTEFLKPSDPSEQHYFIRSIAHIQKQGIDKPFAIKYHNDTRAHRQFFAVRVAVKSYGSDTIWSFWGMEYIKTLLLLFQETKEHHYLEAADFHIESYKQNMLRDGGFPEIYDTNGNFLETWLYRSIRQNSWVIGFEQVLAMRTAIGDSHKTH